MIKAKNMGQLTEELDIRHARLFYFNATLQVNVFKILILKYVLYYDD